MKKIAVEVKKHSQDISNIVTSLSSLTKELGDIKKKAVSTIQATGGSIPTGNAKFVVTPQVTAKEVNVDDEVDDEESIDTTDVKNLLSDIPDDEDDVDDDAVIEVIAAGDPDPTPATAAAAPAENTEELIKSLGYDELKKYCKEKGLSIKGTKDVLMQRALASI